MGSYHHQGYGTLHLRLDTDPKNASKQILVADREKLAFPVQWRFEHVSGDYWVVWRYSYVDTARPSAVYAAHVDTTVSGDVQSISLQVSEGGAGKGPLEIVFARFN